MRLRSFVAPVAVLTGLTLGACGRGPQKVATTPTVGSAEPVGPLEHGRWMPEGIDGGEVVDVLPDGTTRAIVSRVRVELGPDGSMRRAPDVLPALTVPASIPGWISLPQRLGGGYIFQSAASGSVLYRARSFLDPLDPLVRLRVGPVLLSAGPDRLFARTIPGDRVLSIDLGDGSVHGAQPLPPAARYGAIAFADASRGAVLVDLIGALVTGDGGESWTPISIPQPRTATVDGSDLVILGASSRSVVDARGRITQETVLPAEATSTEVIVRTPPRLATKQTFGKRPLVAAIQSGFPIDDESAVVVANGVIGRVRLGDGALVESNEGRLPGEEDATCRAIRFGARAGLVCGGPLRGTTIYALNSALEPHVTAQFAEPREVAPSENGALVVSGSCARADIPRAPLVSHCIVRASGPTQELLTRPIDRVVALADGRAAVLLPKLGEGVPQVAIVDGHGASHAVRLQPEEARITGPKPGVLLDGFFEAAPGEIAGWIEDGGAVSGVHVRLEDGVVSFGRSRDAATTIFAGRYAAAALDNDGGAETSDGGLTWHEVKPPPFASRVKPGATCGPVGCVVPFDRGNWLRVGWGPPLVPHDLEEPKSPAPSAFGATVLRSPTLRCELHNPPKKTNVKVPTATANARRPQRSREVDWSPFHEVPPPSVGAGAALYEQETGSSLDHGRLYAWAEKGGSVGAGTSGMVARFFDRFSPDGVRSSTTTVPPWRDEASLADAMGYGGSSATIHAFLDPGGHAALFAIGRSSASWELVGAVAGRPLSFLPDPDDGPFPRIVSPSSTAVWADEAFYFTAIVGATLVIYRTDSTHSRVLATLPRVGAGTEQLRLVRRAHSRGLGLLVSGVASPGGPERDFYLLSIDPESGKTGTFERLAAINLGGTMPPPCDPDEDGWLVDTTIGGPPDLRGVGGPFRDPEFRLRLDVGKACVEAIAMHTLVESVDEKAAAKPKKPGNVKEEPTGKGIPVAALTPGGHVLSGVCR